IDQHVIEVVSASTLPSEGIKSACLRDNPRPRENRGDVRPRRLQACELPSQEVRMPAVIAVEESYELASGSLKPDVPGVCRAIVLCCYERQSGVATLAYFLTSLVGGSVIDNDVFKVSEPLAKDGVNRFAYVGTDVVGRRDYRHKRCGLGTVSGPLGS